MVNNKKDVNEESTEGHESNKVEKLSIENK